MDMTLYLGTKNYSSWSLRPWLAAKKAGIEFGEVIIDFDQPDTESRILEVSPSGKVPVLIHKGLKVWDSLAICEYFAEIEPKLWPEQSELRAVARSVSAEMHSGFLAIRKEMGMNVKANQRKVTLTNEAQKELLRIDQIWTDLRHKHYAQGDWLFGKFSIADAMFAPVAIRLKAYAVETSPTMQAYVETFYNDSTFLEWIKDAEQDALLLPRLECGQV